MGLLAVTRRRHATISRGTISAHGESIMPHYLQQVFAIYIWTGAIAWHSGWAKRATQYFILKGGTYEASKHATTMSACVSNEHTCMKFCIREADKRLQRNRQSGQRNRHWIHREWKKEDPKERRQSDTEREAKKSERHKVWLQALEREMDRKLH